MVGLNRLTFDIRKDEKTKKEEVEMKKIFLLVIALMMVVSAAFAENITKENLPDLKGTWTGWVTFQIGVNSPCELQILNDTVPVRAKLTVSMLPDSIAPMMGQLAGPGGTYSFSNDEGKITSQGSLMFAGSKNFVEFFLKRNKLDGWFYHNGAKGDILLHKK
jgi:hypothetical protein